MFSLFCCEKMGGGQGSGINSLCSLYRLSGTIVILTKQQQNETNNLTMQNPSMEGMEGTIQWWIRIIKQDIVITNARLFHPISKIQLMAYLADLRSLAFSILWFSFISVIHFLSLCTDLLLFLHVCCEYWECSWLKKILLLSVPSILVPHISSFLSFQFFPAVLTYIIFQVQLHLFCLPPRIKQIQKQHWRSPGFG